MKTLARQTYENSVIVAFEAWDERRRRVYADYLNSKNLGICSDDENERRRSAELSRADNILHVELANAWGIYEKSGDGGQIFSSMLIKAEKL